MSASSAAAAQRLQSRLPGRGDCLDGIPRWTPIVGNTKRSPAMNAPVLLSPAPVALDNVMAVVTRVECLRCKILAQTGLGWSSACLINLVVSSDSQGIVLLIDFPVDITSNNVKREYYYVVPTGFLIAKIMLLQSSFVF